MGVRSCAAKTKSSPINLIAFVVNTMELQVEREKRILIVLNYSAALNAADAPGQPYSFLIPSRGLPWQQKNVPLKRMILRSLSDTWDGRMAWPW